MNEKILIGYIILFFPVLIINIAYILSILIIPFLIFGFIVLPRKSFSTIIAKINELDNQSDFKELFETLIIIQKEITNRFSFWFFKSSEIFFIEKIILKIYLILIKIPYYWLSSFMDGMKAGHIKFEQEISEKRVYFLKILALPFYPLILLLLIPISLWVLWPLIILLMLIF